MSSTPNGRINVNNFPTLKEFQIYLSDQRSVKFTSALRSYFLYFLVYFDTIQFNAKNVRDLFYELRTRKDHPIKPSTLNVYLRVVKLLGKYLNIKEFDDFRSFSVKEAIPLGDMISDPNMERLSDLYVKRKNTSKRNEKSLNLKYQTALTLLRFSGMPPVDLCNLKWKHDKGTHFEYHREKTGKRMRVPIVPQLRDRLSKLDRYSHQYIFGSSQGRMREQTLRDEIKKRCALLNIRGHITPYSFRYSTITYCYVNGGEGMLTKLPDIFGHSIETAHKHYIKYDIQVLTDALYATHPGLLKQSPIDTTKRVIIKLLENLVDRSKYEVKLIIRSKKPDIRVLQMS